MRSGVCRLRERLLDPALSHQRQNMKILKIVYVLARSPSVITSQRTDQHEICRCHQPHYQPSCFNCGPCILQRYDRSLQSGVGNATVLFLLTALDCWVSYHYQLGYQPPKRIAIAAVHCEQTRVRLSKNATRKVLLVRGLIRGSTIPYLCADNNLINLLHIN